MFYDDGPNKTTTMKISDITFSNIAGTASIPGKRGCGREIKYLNFIVIYFIN